jgi:hypothetical protein
MFIVTLEFFGGSVVSFAKVVHNECGDTAVTDFTTVLHISFTQPIH